ncbi:MAG: hypothetical protein LBQ65_03340 [Tannerellaceae bacterium]|jgi:hypothetical protein|nr:hypothetical protein [Tannerellaceae bacterium]
MRRNKKYEPSADASKILAILLLCLSPACINEDYSDCPPNKGEIRISTYWLPRSEEAKIPGSYIFHSDEYRQTGLVPEEEPIILSHAFPADSYHIYLYNEASEIRVSRDTAYANTANGRVAPMPGWFFAYSTSLRVIADSIIELHAQMRQEVRLLTLELTAMGEAAQRIKSLDATLSGVASELYMNDGSVGKPADVSFHLASFPDNIWQASVRLLGLCEETQWLKLTAGIQTAEGKSDMLTGDAIDVSSLLSNFNMDKHYPMTLRGKIYLKTEPGEPVLMSMEIRDWDVVYGTSFIAD